VRLLPKGMYHNEFQLPSLTLADPTGLIDLAVSEVRMNSVHRNQRESSSKQQAFIRPLALEKAQKVFNSIMPPGKQGVSIYRLGEVLSELGLNLNASDVTEIVSQLELKDTLDVSFAEAVEIAAYIHEQKSAAQRSDFY
jgi:Ca2+-binding EF-hand superfamily protein